MSKKNRKQVAVEDTQDMEVVEGQDEALEPVEEKKPNRFKAAFKKHKAVFLSAAAGFLGGITVSEIGHHMADSYAYTPDQDDIPEEDPPEDWPTSESEEFSD